jgi:hypothetical protein
MRRSMAVAAILLCPLAGFPETGERTDTCFVRFDEIQTGPIPKPPLAPCPVVSGALVCPLIPSSLVPEVVEVKGLHALRVNNAELLVQIPESSVRSVTVTYFHQNRLTLTALDSNFTPVDVQEPPQSGWARAQLVAREIRWVRVAGSEAYILSIAWACCPCCGLSWSWPVK